MQQSTSESSNISLEKVWENPTQLKSLESISFDPSKNMVYVSIVDGKPDDKDNKGLFQKYNPQMVALLI